MKRFKAGGLPMTRGCLHPSPLESTVGRSRFQIRGSGGRSFGVVVATAGIQGTHADGKCGGFGFLSVFER
jgi:hypothetical protein